MRGKLKVMAATLAIVSCAKEGLSPDMGINYEYGKNIPHEMIVLGDRLQNPYTTENMTKAFASLYPTKADRVDIKPTNLYVRFLPRTDDEYRMLEDLGLNLLDHPLDYSIAVDGDWYHDPQVPEESVTWQYTVVPSGFSFPDIPYEVIDACYIAENDPGTKSDGFDWEAVEREAYRITGNEDMLAPLAQTKAEKVAPSGRITIVDEDSYGGKPFGVSGVRVSCNSFVKFADAYTDRDGYYKMSKTFAAKLRYRLIFKNEKGFALGFNLILVPASISTLGKSGPEGVDITVTKDSETKLFRRCVVNNAAYDYFQRCSKEDLNISEPPADLRIWLLNGMEASSAPMLHHGAVIRGDLFSSFLGKFASLIEAFLPDITIGTKERDDYKSLYSVTCHELAHASHFRKTGLDYWNNYIYYIVESFVRSGGMTYGDSSTEKAGYCEIGEMWAYYLESRMYKDHYGGQFPTFGTSFWFYPQIFRYLDERGMSVSDIFSVLKPEVVSKDMLKGALISSFPSKRNEIEQVFSRYGN
ncbi:MAG: hypothetical protein ACI3ZS_00110 [Candidatus Cryptobacteroides sp.]